MLDVERAFDVKLEQADYLAVVEGKTAPLFSLSCRLGAVQGRCDEAVGDAVAAFGADLGVALPAARRLPRHRGRRDRQARWPRPRAGDLRCADPVRVAGRGQRPQLAGLLLEPDFDGSDMRRVCEPGRRHRGIGTARRLAADRIDRALGALDALPPSHGREQLEAMARQLEGSPGMELEPPLLDVVIVGAGVAGCSAAIQLATAGMEVAIVQDAVGATPAIDLLLTSVAVQALRYALELSPTTRSSRSACGCPAARCGR